MKNTKRSLCLIVALIMLAAMLAASVNATTSWDGRIPAPSATPLFSGSGTQSSPYLIQTAKDLAQFCADVNAGYSYRGKYLRLTNSVSVGMTGGIVHWPGIGTLDTPFRGTFDGAGNVIQNLKVNAYAGDGDEPYGSFFNCTNGATIKNLFVSGAVYNRSGYGDNICAGGIVSYAENTTVSNCSSITSVTAELENVATDGTYTAYSGGIVGHMDGGLLDTCLNYGKVDINYGRWFDSVQASVTLYGGGIVGCATGGAVIRNCVNEAAIELTGDGKYTTQFAGGIAGVLDGSTVTNCYSTGAPEIHHGISGSYSAGLVSKNDGVVNNSYSTSSASTYGIQTSSDPLVGTGSGEAVHCYFYYAGGVGAPKTYGKECGSFGADGKVTPVGADYLTVGGTRSESGSALLAMLNAGRVSGASQWITEENLNSGYPVLTSSLVKITPGAGTGGTTDPAVAFHSLRGKSVTIKVSPDTGWHIKDVKINGSSAGAQSSHTFYYVYSDITLSATFERDEFTVTSGVGANGNVSPSGKTTVRYGDSLTFTFTPDKGYKVSAISVDGVETPYSARTYTLENITANVRLSVYFEVDPFYTPDTDTVTVTEPVTEPATQTDTDPVTTGAVTDPATTVTEPVASDVTTGINKSDDNITDPPETEPVITGKENSLTWLWVLLIICVMIAAVTSVAAIVAKKRS